MKTILLIMAAGIGSRFRTEIKQLEPVDVPNHIIIDYSWVKLRLSGGRFDVLKVIYAGIL